MPISIQYKNKTDQNCVIRPAPLVSISQSTIRNKHGKLGVTYAITLQGDLILDNGFPLAKKTNGDFFPYWDATNPSGNIGPYNTFDNLQSHTFDPTLSIDNRPKRQIVPFGDKLTAMFNKQKALRALFAQDGQRMEIIPVNMDDPPIICYPRLVGDISFTEGVYVDTCKYTINLEADVLYNDTLEVDEDGHPLFDYTQDTSLIDGPLTLGGILEASGRFIESFSDNWSLEVDDALGESKDLIKSYRITRSFSATGKDFWGPGDLSENTIQGSKKAAWEQARDFVHYRLVDSTSGNYPNTNEIISYGINNLANAYRGYNHSRTESIGIDEGTYSVTENWLLCSGISYENYNMSVDASIDAAFINVSINGSIKGLTEIPSSGKLFGGIFPNSGLTPYENALTKYYEVSNSGKFGLTSDIFKRADNAVAVKLNAQPKSASIAMNEYDGSITYALNFDNRPTNIISGVLTESIDISDTYPGDVFALIPVIGRATGPVLQNIGGRTEYRRDVSINLLLDYTDVAYGSSRKSLLLQKPTVVEPSRTQLKNLLKELSPEKEPGIRKWFLSPPQEQWSPKTGAWSLSLSWTYELDK